MNISLAVHIDSCIIGKFLTHNYMHILLETFYNFIVF